MTKAEGAGQEEGPVQGSWTLPTQAAGGGLSQARWSAARDCLQRFGAGAPGKGAFRRGGGCTSPHGDASCSSPVKFNMAKAEPQLVSGVSAIRTGATRVLVVRKRRARVPAPPPGLASSGSIPRGSSPLFPQSRW